MFRSLNRILALFLALIMAVSLFGIAASAEESDDDTAVVTRSGVPARNPVKTKDNGESEVLFSFDSTDISNWVSVTQGYGITIDSSRVTAETGRVHSGDGACAIHVDYRNDCQWDWSWCGIRNDGGDVTIPKEATAIGLWVYVPKEAVAWEMNLYPYRAYNGSWHRMNGYPNSDYPEFAETYTHGWTSTLQEDGWHYFSFDLSGYDYDLLIPGAQGLSVMDPVETALPFVEFYLDLGESNEEYNYRFSDYANVAGNFTFYIDDITLDYDNNKVPDRELPEFSGFSYSIPNSQPVEIAKDAVPTVASSEFSFSASVTDNAAIDPATAKAYIDGVEVNAGCSNGSVNATAPLTTKDNTPLTPADGIHTLKLSVCDTSGNYASVIRQIKVDANTGISTVRIEVPGFGANDPLRPLGSLSYINLVADDIAAVDTVQAQFQLNTKTDWELDHISVPYGFTAGYSLRTDNNVATVTITKTGDVELEGEQVLASIPIRAWLPTEAAEARLKETDYKPSYSRTDVSFDTIYGLMTTDAGDKVPFSALRQAKDTEVNGSYRDNPALLNTPWHRHTEVNIDNVTAGCTTGGYSDRTKCSVCDSIVDWGDSTPPNGHQYTKDPDWEWNHEDHSAVAKFTCQAAGCGHEKSIGADVEKSTEDGIDYYAASVEFNDNTYTDVTTAFTDGIGARLVGHTLSLDGDIGVNFFMELDPAIAQSENAKMHFTIPNSNETTEVDVPVSQATISGDYYVFKCNVSAKEMTSEIKAQIIDGEKRGTEYKYSIKEYADYLLTHADANGTDLQKEYEKAKPLVKALLNYGTASQTLFGVNVDKPANADLSDDDRKIPNVTAEDINKPYDDTDTVLPDNVAFIKTTLSLKTETTLSLYFRNTGDKELTFTCNKDKNVEPEHNNKTWIARIRGITASEIGDDFTLTVSDGTTDGTVTYNPLTYCYNVLKRGVDDEHLSDVVKALYWYWQEASIYFA